MVEENQIHDLFLQTFKFSLLMKINNRRKMISIQNGDKIVLNRCIAQVKMGKRQAIYHCFLSTVWSTFEILFYLHIIRERVRVYIWRENFINIIQLESTKKLLHPNY